MKIRIIIIMIIMKITITIIIKIIFVDRLACLLKSLKGKMLV